MYSMRGILIDLDGVLYQDEKVVPGAVEFVEWLQEEQIAHLFVTNTSSRPRKAIHKKLYSLGIKTEPERIFTPVIAASQWLKEYVEGPSALFISPSTMEDLSEVPQLPPDKETGAGSVVVGDLGEGWDYSVMNRAFRLLMEDTKPPLVALGMTRYWRAADGLRLDVAPIIKALEHAVACEAIVVGKPSKAFFNQALQIIGMPAEKTIMIGDDIVGDVKGAQTAGIRGILVRTGKFRPSDLEGSIVPHTVLDSIADLPAWWQKNEQ
jgi:HAD superfamily hydrolase (TIGR01458 family)